MKNGQLKDNIMYIIYNNQKQILTPDLLINITNETTKNNNLESFNFQTEINSEVRNHYFEHPKELWEFGKSINKDWGKEVVSFVPYLDIEY
jgi:hypothetical protein